MRLRRSRTSRTSAQRALWSYDDGGRAASGRKGLAGDCAVRAVAIAAERGYGEVYDELAALNKLNGGSRSAREGIPIAVLRSYLRSAGWDWTPTMSIGSGTQVHLRAHELPPGRIIARVTRHVCAVVDGVIHDVSDPSRGGTRCVYGYWSRGEELRQR